MQDRMPEDKPTRVPARANRWWNQSSAIGLGGTEGLTGILGDRAKSALPLERAPTDRRAGCGKPACPVRREGEREHALPTPIDAGHFATRRVEIGVTKSGFWNMLWLRELSNVSL